jgi:hypothetical protein
MRQLKAGRPIRIICLKPRQIGLTTIFEAILFSRTATAPNVESLITAHDKDSAQHILSISEMFYAHFPPDLRPLRRLNNRTELFFDVPVNPIGGVAKEDELRAKGLNSRIRIETAANMNLGISRTIQNLHLSEFARWPDPKRAMGALRQSVPHLPQTMMIIESTALGVGNMFHTLYERAREGKGDFEAVFIPFYIHEEYRMPVEPGFKRTHEERLREAEWGLDQKLGEDVADQVLNWRRWAIEEKCDGDLDLFHQEYPATDTEAFVASGRNVFNFFMLRDHYRPMANQVQGEGYQVRDEERRVEYGVKERRGQLVEQDGKIVFESNPRGPLRLYREPKPERRYVVTCDPSEGKEGGNYSAMCVGDRYNKEQCAVWRDRVDTDIVADELVMLGRYYNVAWLMPERNAMGVAVINRARQKYPKIFKKEKFTRSGIETDYGWRSTPGAKEAIVEIGARTIRKGEVNIYDMGTVEELMRFVRDDGGKLHGDGNPDDRVIAWLIMLYACETLGAYLEEEPEKQKLMSPQARYLQELLKRPELRDPVIVGSCGYKGWEGAWYS